MAGYAVLVPAPAPAVAVVVPTTRSRMPPQSRSPGAKHRPLCTTAMLGGTHPSCSALLLSDESMEDGVVCGKARRGGEEHSAILACQNWAKRRSVEELESDGQCE